MCLCLPLAHAFLDLKVAQRVYELEAVFLLLVLEYPFAEALAERRAQRIDFVIVG